MFEMNSQNNYFKNQIALAMPGPFFFHGFLRLISRAREIENDAFHGLIIQFHGHFTGYFLNFTTFSWGFHRLTNTNRAAHVLWKARPCQTLA